MGYISQAVRKRRMVMTVCSFFVLAIMCTVASGCGKKAIFVDESLKYQLTALGEKELSTNSYYIKQGADFYKSYEPEGTAQGITTKPSPSRLFWLEEDSSLVPALYNNELIAFPSDKTELKQISLERYEDVGWSFGLFGGYIDTEGNLCYSFKKNCIEGSDAFEKLKGVRSDSLRIVSINDTPVDEGTINDAGVITGLEKNGQYVVAYYAGTFYDTVTLTVDKMFLKSFEVMQISKAYSTKNGYLAVYMPDDFPSGWYYINGSGLFRYYDYQKGDESEQDTDMNAPYYQTLADSMEAYSQQFVASVAKKTENVVFSVAYSTEVYDDKDVSALLIAPDGTQYGMTAEGGIARTEIAEVMAGRWKIAVTPKDLEIMEVKTNAADPTADTVSEERLFIMEEDDANIQFSVSYDGTGEVWGIVENQNTGESRSFNVDRKNQKLTTTYAYLPAGTYKVTVFHYADSLITDIGYGIDSSNVEEEIITVIE